MKLEWKPLISRSGPENQKRLKFYRQVHSRLSLPPLVVLLQRQGAVSKAKWFDLKAWRNLMLFTSGYMVTINYLHILQFGPQATEGAKTAKTGYGAQLQEVCFVIASIFN